MAENVSQELARDQVEQNSLEPHSRQEEQLTRVIQRDITTTVNQELNFLKRRVADLETQRMLLQNQCNVPGHPQVPVQPLPEL
jgi:3-phenylpropionate/cinnamic acid dioxygenase small subunit